MKKFAALLVALSLSFGLVACGGAEKQADPAPTEEAAPAAEAAPAEEAAPVEEAKPLEKFEGDKMEKAEADE